MCEKCSSLVEHEEKGYTVKTSQTTPGTKIHCETDHITFEKIDDESVKITVPGNMKIIKA